ncbi:Rid family hydrolase [Rhizobium sp. RU36D]|uniref:Rid family hydrolase n=1 Tax=Rhizobium sp. RU36D TaxID=1907415 RepID=UPI0009D7A4AA|nr:Rid family hydrolase [Rhizobium sp. RU36D]SMC71429.1 Enamine deaminase RidA, house cleaning of reactive enamine intermediates, YjgF/YER057c/UK114 family [Rhizobium sp. RU36D]
MTRKSIYSNSEFERLAGYSRAVVDGEWIFISGTSGFDPALGGFAASAEDQAKRVLEIISATLAEADASMADIVSVRVYLASRDDVVPVSMLLGAVFSDPRPTNTTIICGFPVEAIKVEIEAVARRRSDA